MEKTEKKDTVRRVYRKYDKKNKGFILFEDLLYVIDHDLKEENIDKDLI
jgi:centrin-1